MRFTFRGAAGYCALAIATAAWLGGCDVEDKQDGGMNGGGQANDAGSNNNGGGQGGAGGMNNGGGQGGGNNGGGQGGNNGGGQGGFGGGGQGGFGGQGGQGGQGGFGGGGGGGDCAALCANAVDCAQENTGYCPAGRGQESVGMQASAACAAACMDGDFDVNDLAAAAAENDCGLFMQFLVENSSAVETKCGLAVGCDTNDGDSGICVTTGQCANHGGDSVAGVCPGGNDVQCCVNYGCGDGAACKSTDACGGTPMPGLCPGPSGVQCCVE
jgi:hypothetical protein